VWYDRGRTGQLFGGEPRSLDIKSRKQPHAQ
jgi:hypothetical protein